MIIANWKMNTTRSEAIALAQDVRSISCRPSTKIGICPPAIWTDAVSNVLKGSSVLLGMQNCIGDPFGAQTGCINAEMAKGAGCQLVILGHSERRARFSETTEMLVPAVASVLETGNIPVFCIGETLAERDSGRAIEAVVGQLKPLLNAGLDLDGLIIAYEPVWAIGAGHSATVGDIGIMHRTIRAILDRPDALVLYGGSVSPESAGTVFSSAEVSGALVGGASLNAEKFAAIVAAWEQN